RLFEALPPGSAPLASAVVDDLYSLMAAPNEPASWIRRYNLLYAGAAQLARTMNVEEIFPVLREHLHVAVAVRSPRRLFVRAGDRAHAGAGGAGASPPYRSQSTPSGFRARDPSRVCGGRRRAEGRW